MPTLYVRNLPDELHRKLKRLAAERQRSLGAQVIVLLESGLEQEALIRGRAQALEQIAKRRRGFRPPSGATDSLELLREDRKR